MVIISIFLISVFAATYTNIGFPYQDESSGNPVVQRHHVMVKIIFIFNGFQKFKKVSDKFFELILTVTNLFSSYFMTNFLHSIQQELFMMLTVT